MPIIHSKVSTLSNNGDPNLVQPTDWNAAHVASGTVDLSGATSVVLPGTTFTNSFSAGLPTTVLAFSATPSFTVTTNASYSMVLTGNVTSSTTSGTPLNGNLLGFHLCQDNVGGHTFAWPANFLATPTIQTGANVCTDTIFKFDGTKWSQLIQPAGSGGNPAGASRSLQLNNAGAFGASAISDTGSLVSIGEDLFFSGPNPHFDIRAFGGFISSSPGTMTCSINSSSTTLTCNSNPDFLDATGIPGSSTGHGVYVPGAGALPTIVTPGTPTVTPNLLNGSTTWNYKVIAEDYKGGLTAASVAGTTTTGSATLGLTSFTITTATRTNGTSTYTTSANHNLQVGASVMICQFGGGSCNAQSNYLDLFNGTKYVASVPSGTTFATVESSSSIFDGTETPASGQGWVRACNTLTFPANSFSGQGTLRYWIYRSQGAGAYALAGVAIGLDPYFVDCGGSAPTAPSYVPATPPAAAQAGYLATTIASGGGTTTLTLAASAGSTVSNVTVQHDNSQNLLAAMNAATVKNGGTIYIPSFATEVGGSPVYWNFISTTDTTTVPITISSTPNVLTILVNGHVGLNQPWILRSGLLIQGMTKRASSFMYPGGADIGGAAIPNFYIKAQTGVTFRNLFINASTAQGTGIFSDTNGSGGGSAGIILENVGLGNQLNTGNATGRNMVVKGGFDYFFRQVTCDPGLNSNADYLPTPCIDFTNSSVAVEGTSQNAGRVIFDSFYNSNSGIRVTSAPNSNTGGATDYRFNSVLSEAMLTPFLRIGPIGFTQGYTLTDIVDADRKSGIGTPIIEASGSQLRAVSWTDGIATSASGQPIIIGGSNIFATNYPTTNIGASPWLASTQYTGTPIVEVGNQPLALSGSSRTIYQMTIPTAPSGCVVSSGGSVPIATHTYQLTAVDQDGQETLMGPSVSVTTTTGNQTVTCNVPSIITGSRGFDVYRDGNRANVGSCPAQSGGLPQITGSTFVDSASGTCGNSPPNVTSAGSSILASSGLTSYQNRLIGGGNASTWSGSFTANRTVTVPDLSGTVVLDSNLPSVSSTSPPVFDNFNRANGGLGANWTTSNGSLQISNNQVVGNSSITHNMSVWTGSTLSNDQFAEIVLTVPGTQSIGQTTAAVVRGSSSGLSGYECTENTTTAAIVKDNAGSFTTLVSTSVTGTTGDVIRCEAQGTTLRLYQNGVLLLTTTDSSFASGSTGIKIYSNSSQSADNFTAGSLNNIFTSLAHSENDFSLPQHLQILTVGNPAPIPGTLAAGTAYLQNLVIGSGTSMSGSVGNGGLAQETTSAAKTNGHFASFDANGNIIDSGVSTSTATALSNITAALTSNSINNANNPQTWNWAQTTAAQTAFTFTENVAATGGAGSQFLTKIGTIAGSTSVPLNIFNSLTGTQTLPTLSITPTWNTSGVVDAALFLNVTNTASGGGSLLADFQVGNTSEWKVDKAGNSSQLGVANIGSTPPNCSPGTAGGSCYNEGTSPTTGTTFDTIYADSTQQAVSVNNHNTGNMALSRITCVNVTPITANTNTTNDQNLMSCSLNANVLNVVGRTLKVWTASIYTTPSASTATITTKLKLCTVSGCGSGTVLTLATYLSSANPGAVTNNSVNTTTHITTQTGGATSAYEVHGNMVIDLGATPGLADQTFSDNNAGTISPIDSTGALFLQITGTFSVASATNSITQRQLLVEVLN